VQDLIKKPIEIFHKNIIEKIVLLWETRGLRENAERLITVMAVAIYYDGVLYEEEFEKAKEILDTRVKSKSRVAILFERIRLKIDEYIQDREIFERDIELAVKYIVEDIQLYGVAKDIFEADGSNDEEEKKLEQLIKEEYDKHYTYKKDESIFD